MQAVYAAGAHFFPRDFLKPALFCPLFHILSRPRLPSRPLPPGLPCATRRPFVRREAIPASPASGPEAQGFGSGAGRLRDKTTGGGTFRPAARPQRPIAFPLSLRSSRARKALFHSFFFSHCVEQIPVPPERRQNHFARLRIRAVPADIREYLRAGSPMPYKSLPAWKTGSR